MSRVVGFIFGSQGLRLIDEGENVVCKLLNVIQCDLFNVIT